MSSKFPELPSPAYPELDSMLARKFGREVANYFSGSPLNRVSFLRSDHTFLNTALNHKTTRFLLFESLKPLVNNPSSLATVSLSQINRLIEPEFFAKPEKQLVEEYNSSTYIPQVVFLGLDERNVPKSGSSETFVWKDQYRGAPLFAVDVTPKSNKADAAKSIISELTSAGKSFQEGRMILGLPADEAAVYAQARSLLDWNQRNPFCAACGQPTMSVNAGGKRICPSTDQALLEAKTGGGAGPAVTPSANRPDCVTRLPGVSNISFPRTDPTAIMAVVSADGQKILLGRQKRWPQYWYSTLAGFIEPAESIEEAVRREVYEESGVTVGRVVIHSSQPWPYPANLMIGAIGQATPDGEKIDLGNDPELQDAKWFTFDEVREALQNGVSGLGEDAPPNYKEGNLRLPPPTAIANRLVHSVVVDGFLSAQPKM